MKKINKKGRRIISIVLTMLLLMGGLVFAFDVGTKQSAIDFVRQRNIQVANTLEQTSFNPIITRERYCTVYDDESTSCFICFKLQGYERWGEFCPTLNEHMTAQEINLLILQLANHKGDELLRTELTSEEVTFQETTPYPVEPPHNPDPPEDPPEEP